MNRPKEAVINLATNHYKLVAVAFAVITLITGAFFPLVVMDTDPENMLEKSEPVRVFHNETKERFNLSDIVVLGVINRNDPDGVFNPASLRRIYALTNFAKSLRWRDSEDPDRFEGVIEVDIIAPSVVDHMSQAGPGTIRFEWLMQEPPDSREEARAIRDKALSNPLLKGQMVSEDGKAICIYLPLTDKLLSYRVYTELRNQIAALGGEEEYHIIGLPVAESAVGVEMFKQMSTASPLAMIVILGLLLLFFRRWTLVILPMIVATVSIVSSMGLMIALGFPVHILSSMLPIFLMSIAMVDSVHVLSEFFDVYTPEKGRLETIREVMNTLFAPMLYTSLTTSAGFLSLTLAPIPPARVFGAFLSLGVMIAWLVTILFVPAYIMMIPERRLKNFGLRAQQGVKQNLLTRILRETGKLTFHHPKAVLFVTAVAVAVAIWGITKIQINDNYAKRFAMSHPIRKADIALNQHFGGTYTAYLILEGNGAPGLPNVDATRIRTELIRHAESIRDAYPEAPRLAEQLAAEMSRVTPGSRSISDFVDASIALMQRESVGSSDEVYFAWQEIETFLALEKEKVKVFKNPEVLEYMVGLQDHLLATGLVGKCNSVADVVRKVNQELIDGRDENFRIPRKLQGVGECYMQYQQSHRPNDLWHLVTPDFMQANIWMQFPTGDSMNTKATVQAVDAYFANHTPPVGLTYRWAGLHYLNRVLEVKLVWGFLKSFLGSFLIILLMMTFLFRSILWGVLCMVPLTVTLVAIYGITGLIGKDYDLPIAVLSALSIGMAVDFAIHFLQRSRANYAERGSWEETSEQMFGEPARAISRNVLVIAIGFLPLLTASLIPYKTTGIMLFAILALSGVVTLLFLPAVLRVGEKSFFRNVSYASTAPEAMEVRTK